MSNEQFFSINLPKWPECRVKGETVTRDQAAEIIIRTQSFYFCTNDKQFERELFYCLEVDYVNKWPHYDFDEKQKKAEEYHCLDLEYLENARIVSSFIGGPNGWINWNGIVQQTGKNIGKWPDVQTVYEEWVKIAEAFPFLNLTCQLFDGEGCEENTKPVIEFQVKDGKVEMSLPVSPVFDGIKNDVIEGYLLNFSNLNRERGCTIPQFQAALEIVKNKINS